MDLDERLTLLERQRLSITPAINQCRESMDQVRDLLVEILEKKYTGPAYHHSGVSAGTMQEGFSIRETATDLSETLAQLVEKVFSQGIQMGHPNNFAYIPGSDNQLASLGDYIGASLNPYTGNAMTNVGAAAMHRALLDWVGSFLGYSGDFGGDITSGGSLANLAAIITAREAYQIRPETVRQMVVYYSEYTHHSVPKALHIAGLGYCQQRVIDANEDFTINLEQLEKTIQADRDAGYEPWLIIANAGTTDTGAVDDLDAVADLAEAYQCWFHCDGAYGASFALCTTGKAVLKGIERSDSVVLDPHKGLFLPFGCGVVLVKDRQLMLQAHHFTANYMRDAIAVSSDSPASYSAELTRPFRALRMWLPLTVAGTAPFQAALEEKLLLAQYAYTKLSQLKNLWLGPAPQLSTIIFRYISSGADHDDEINQALAREIMEQGDFFISTTTLQGHIVLRLSILAVRTNRRAIDDFVAMLTKKINCLSGQSKAEGYA